MIRRFLLCSLVTLTCAAPLLAAVKVADQGERCTAHFRLKPEGGAQSVHVAGSFNGWSKDATPLTDDDKDGVFEATVTLDRARHTYKFVINGSQWIQDKENPKADADGMGGFNSVLDLTKGAASSGSGAKGDAKDGGQGSAFGSTVERRSEPSFVAEIFFLDPSTKRLPDYSKLPAKGKIFAPKIDVEPQSFAKGFPGLTDRFEWFGLRYRGVFRAEKTGVYRFRLLSDDGAKLYINGRLAIDNDGLHGPRSKTQMIKLKKGDHKLVLDYMQGPALEVALQLFVTKPRSTQEEILKPCTTPKDKGARTR